MPVEIVTSALVLVLALVVVVMMGLGVGGVLGVLRFVRCERCDRIGIVSGSDPAPKCMHCSHERLLHPLAVHRAHAHQPRG